MIIQKIELEELMWTDWTDNFEVIDRGKWVSEGKYDHMRVIIRHKETQLYYGYYFSRSGSYFTDYDFGIDSEPNEIKLTEVVSQTIEITNWVPVS